MRGFQLFEKSISHRGLIILCSVVLVTALSQPAQARPDPQPPVPPTLAPPAGNKLYLVGHATGTQQYMCVNTGAAFAWAFFGPQATLFKDEDGKPIIFHYLSPNPVEGGAARATWQHAHDGSTVWAAVTATVTDTSVVAPGAIPWLLLQVVGVQSGPGNSGKLARTTFIQRLYTSGGVAPSTGCAAPADIGQKALVPYTTDYYFYRAAGGKTAGDE